MEIMMLVMVERDNIMKTRALRQANLMRDRLENLLKAGSRKGDEMYMEKRSYALK